MLEPPIALGDNILVTPFYCFEFLHGLLIDAAADAALLVPGGLWVEQAQIRHVPWISHVFIGLRVLQPICASSNDLGDYERSFQLRGEFVQFFLYQSQDKVSLAEGSSA